AKARLLEGLDKHGNVGLGKPGRQRIIACRIAKKSLARLDEGFLRRVGKTERTKQRAEGTSEVALEFRSGNAGRLEVLPVEIGNAIRLEHVERPAAAAEGRGHA